MNAKNIELNDPVFTGRSDKSNPFCSDIWTGIAYDSFECSSYIVEQDGSNKKLSRPVFVHPYHGEARKTASYLPSDRGDIILDVGSGTGISSLQVFLQKPEVKIIGVEPSDSMRNLAMYKFNHPCEANFPEITKDKNIIKYWNCFRKESRPYQNNIEFVPGNIESLDMEHEIFDGAIASQSLHWTDITKSFEQIGKSLKTGKTLAWNTSSNFCEDDTYPSMKYCAKYNDFVGFVIEESISSLDSLGYSSRAVDYKSLSRPRYNTDDIINITSKQGFETENIATYLVPFDMRISIKFHIPALVRSAIKTDANDIILNDVINSSMTRTVGNPGALNDTEHIYEIVPIFSSVKEFR